MKHIKLYESSEKYYYIFRIPDDFQDIIYLFEEEKDAFNFLANKVYNIVKDSNSDLLSTLDEIHDVESLQEFYDELVDENSRLDRIFFERTTPDYAELENWIKMRRDAKKYNL